MEYSGVLTVSPVDVTATNTGSGTPTTTTTGTTATTIQANEVWIGGIGYSSSGPTLGTIINGFTSVNSASVH